MIFRTLRPHISKVPLVIPTGEEIIIEINSGIAFGSGNQPSTKLCIKELESIFKQRKVDKVLDVGCGSGVLAICAVALGASMALALDIDPLIVNETKINVEKNGFSSTVQVLCGSLESVRDKFDLILANIVTNEILKISEELKSKLKSDGLIL